MTSEEKKVVIVTGGTYGMGRAHTLRLAEDGWQVIAFGLDSRQPFSSAENGRTGTEKALAERGLQADILEADVTVEKEVEGVVNFAVERYGHIDGLVNNAAIHPEGTILDTSVADLDKTLAVNVRGVYICMALVLPQMLRQGSGAIVNISSGAGWGKPGLAAYAASKGAVFGLSQAVAHDVKPHHIRVNVVVPGGGIRTGMNEGNEEGQRRLAALAEKTVAGRPMEPNDVSEAVSFLLSDRAAQVTGAVLSIGAFS